MRKEFKFKKWAVTFSFDDGARLNSLSYNGFDLLTTAPESFRPPTNDYGLYETRPVYGYDDCFPSVDSCTFPGLDWTIPDHGELCWLPWQVLEFSDQLLFSVKSKILPLVFKREMHFAEQKLIWTFEVFNEGGETLPFMHIMHPLLPLREIKSLDLPAFESVFDEIQQQTMDLKTPNDVQVYLFAQPPGTVNMLLLQNVQNGKMKLGFKNDFYLHVTFPVELFPTIGIWWNNSGYPDEDGCRRIECALEPIPGTTSMLTEAYRTGTCLSVAPGKRLNWQVVWKILI